MASSLPVFPSFDVHLDGNVGPRWMKWLSRFERLLIALDIDNPLRKRALLLHYAGTDVDEIFDTLAETGEQDNYDAAVQALNAYFSPKVNTAYELYNFRQAKQADNETLDSYHTRLRHLAKTCDFTDVDKEIASQIVLTCTSQRLRRRALRDNLPLKDLLDAGRAFEVSEMQASRVEDDSCTKPAPVNAIHRQQEDSSYNHQSRGRSRGKTLNRRRSQSRNRSQSAGKANASNTQTQCGYCGYNLPHKKSCPAKGKSCNYCGKMGHFTSVCQSRLRKQRKQEVRNVRVESPDTDDEYIYSVSLTVIGQVNSRDSLPIREIALNGLSVPVMIDSGSSVNILDMPTYDRLKRADRSLSLQSSKTRLFPYGSDNPLPVLGTVNADILCDNAATTEKFFVVEGKTGNLLSYQTAERLKLLYIQPSVQAVKRSCDTENTVPDQPDIITQFPDLFKGIGKIKGKQVHLHIDQSVLPKQQPQRRIPFHVRKDVENELQKLESLDIIEKVEGPTPWISPVVVVPKSSGGVRVCIDMREANKAIKREKHPTPTIDDLAADLNSATVFSKLDLTAGYHQLELDLASRNITTFSTHLGLRRYKRLMFGVNAASEIFQNEIAELIRDLSGCMNLSDDIIVYGKDQCEHDKNLNAVLRRLQERGVKLNQDKCVFSTNQIEFYGHVFDANGIAPDPRKIEAITNLDPPRNVSEVKSLLGMSQYVSRFVPNYATMTEPLRRLTHKDIEWSWGPHEQSALDALNQALVSTEVMSFFDPNAPTELLVDASPVGLGAILCQNGKVISYGSRALSATEQRYSQTEREMLAAVWGAERFHLYLFGSAFVIKTDHKPLLGIFESQKPTSARLERWRLRLMPYKCKLVYRPGKDENNPADFISRHPKPDSASDNIAEAYVNYVVANAVPKAMTIDDVRTNTQNDPQLQKLMKAILTGDWTDSDVSDFMTVRNELTVCNGIVLRGNRIVIPQALKMKAVDLAHIGHQGIVKTKQLLRQKVWFPRIDTLAEQCVKSCIPCQAATSRPKTREPLRMTKLPSAPWEEVAIDLTGPFPSGEYILVVVDEHSRFPETDTVTSTSSRAIIPKLDAIFARQGVPRVVKSDNGPPFSGREFKDFATHLGFIHRRVTPLWPEANGEVERFMSTLNKNIRASSVERRNWKQELYKFLRHYRATPHSSTHISPFEALTGRQMNTVLPQMPSTPVCETSISQNDAHSKEKMKSYADKRRNTQSSRISVGDTVLVRQPKKNKLSTPFDPRPYTVTKQNGSMFTARRGNHVITRNASHFKPVIADVPTFEEEEEESEEFDILSSSNPPTSNSLDSPAVRPSEPQLRSCLKPTGEPRRSSRKRKPPVRFKDFVL